MTSKKPNKHSNVLLDRASDWFAKMNSDQTSSQDHIEFSAWLAADPNHEAAYRDIEDLWDKLEVVSSLPDESKETASLPKHIIRKLRTSIATLTTQPKWALTAVFTTVFLSAFIFASISHLNCCELYVTSPGEQKQIFMKDGSTVMLNTDSKIEIKLTDTSREIYLHHGEALFNVAPDPNRPFKVDSGNVTANAVGTVFSVYRKCGETTDTVITVIEGKVKVTDQKISSKTPKKASTLLQAAEQTLYSKSGIGDTQTVDPDIATSWAHQKLIYDGIPLATVLEDLNRYTSSTIKIADESLNSIPVSAVFMIQDQETLLKSLEQAFNLKAINISNRVILLDKAQFYE